MKTLKICFFFLSLTLSAQAQPYIIPKQKIAIFMPLYLDQVYDNEGKYLLANDAFPNNTIAGLDFYQGVQMALDSLNKEGKTLEVFVFDTEAKQQTITAQLNDSRLNGLELIIVNCGLNSLKLFADEGLKRNIPVVNVNLPNSGGVKNNPFFVMLNSTLQTQCERIYQYLQKYYATKKIVVFRKKGQIENMIKNYFNNYSRTTASVPLKYQYVDLPDNFTTAHIKASLDTLGSTVCVAGSLSEIFGKSLATQLAELSKKYTVSLMGMPTWDGNKLFANKDFYNMEIVYCTPFYNPKTDKVSQNIIKNYDTKMFSRPSDMVMRGYEVAWKFGNLLSKHKTDFASNLNSKEFSLFREYDIRPVLNPVNQTIDYFENKKLYFIKWKSGVQIVDN